MFGLGYQELLILMVIIILLFGSARLPSLMRNMGRSVTEFKRGMTSELGEDDEPEENEPAATGKDDKNE